jgi:hypothetical protein
MNDDDGRQHKVHNGPIQTDDLLVATISLLGPERLDLTRQEHG